MLIPEDALLLPKASNLDSDDWPVFELTDVTVTSQTSGTLESLLAAHRENALTVSGRLMEVEDQYHDLSKVRKPHLYNEYIEVNNVTRYCFGEYDDGSYGFWAAGKAGWFLLETPSSSWNPILDSMCEATSILYMMADRLRQAIKSKSRLSKQGDRRYLTRLFGDYSAMSPRGFCSVEDVKQAVDEHRQFLITSMIEGQEKLDWRDTPMMNYYEESFPKDCADIRCRVETSSRLYSVARELPDGVNDVGVRPVAGEEIEKRAKTSGKNSRIYAAIQHHTMLELNTPEDMDPPRQFVEYHSESMRKRKAILRPAGSKVARKTRKASNRIREPIHVAETESTNGEDSHQDMPVAGQSEFMSITSSEQFIALGNPSSINNLRVESPSSLFLPRRYLELSMSEYEIPSFKPQVAGDIWSCNFDGCGAQIYQASSTKGTETIRNHFEAHTMPTQGKIDLVLSESRPYLPVDNLVRRLQGFAATQCKEPGLKSVERCFSAPIRRKY